MNDLLSRSFSPERHGGDGDLESGNMKKFPPSVQLTNMSSAGESMEDFQREIKVVEGEAKKVKQLLMKLQRTNEESKQAHRAEPLKALRAQMDADIASVTKSARLINAKLKKLDESNRNHRQLPGCSAGTALDRLRMTATENQRKKLAELMNDFQGLREKMVDEYKETIQRRYYNVTGKQADEETIESMIRTGESETFLQEAIREQGRGHVIETVREIQERHDGVREIEKHLQELHQVFLDMAVMVDNQGHLLNDIEANVNRATSYTEKGVEHLQGARRLQLNTRKWKFYSILLLLIIILIVTLVVLKLTNII